MYTENTDDERAEWTGNTGFIVVPASSTGLPKKSLRPRPCAIHMVWGTDQGLFNHVAWRENKIQERNPRWNRQPVLQYARDGRRWDYWGTSKMYMLSFYAGVGLRVPGSAYDLVKDAWSAYMIGGRYPKFYDFILP